MLGIVNLSPDEDRLVLRPSNEAARKQLLVAIKQIGIDARIKSDGGDFILDARTAIALRHEEDGIPINWSSEARRFVDGLTESYATRGHALRRLRELEKGSNAAKALSDYDQRNVLDAHQQIAVAAMSDPLIKGLCLFDEQGSGKTVMTIHAFDRLASTGKAASMLIFAPKNMLATWKSDFEKFMGARYRVEIISGNRRSKFESITSRADVYVTNYETAQSMEAPLRSLIARQQGGVILTVDESFFVKNAKAVRSSAVKQLRGLCDRCWMLCGTPAPNNAIDVVEQFNIADRGVTFASVDLPTDPDALRESVQNVVEHRGLYLRRLKQDVLPNLAPKCYQRVGVEMEPVQRGLYQEILTGLIADVVAADERGFRELFTSFLARRMALLQIASNPRLVFPDYAKELPKHAAIDMLLERLIEREDEKVVLWSYFRGSLGELERRYSRYGAVRLDGSITSVSERGEAVRKFQEDPATKLFIANPAAAGAGITLTASRIAIYESFPTQTAHFLQSIDRIHRRGQLRDTHYYFLLTHNSLEEEEYERLLAKDRMGFELFGHRPPELRNRDVFLRELQDGLARLNQ